jgi:hypothetical protein
MNFDVRQAMGSQGIERFPILIDFDLLTSKSIAQEFFTHMETSLLPVNVDTETLKGK